MTGKAEIMLTRTADALYSCWPRRKPSQARLQQAKIVSHRGEHDNVQIRENTIPAFDAALEQGAWGLEFDVRYTADGEPVISHDADLNRVFDNPTVIADTAWSTLRDRVSEVMHLESFIERYAGRAHFMLELKARSSGIGEARLHRVLNSLEAGRDFHILALDPALFAAVRDLPDRCRLPVARANTRRMLDYALTHECAGLAGSYALLGADHIAELQAAGRQFGTGFIANQSVLWREINRGVDWLFTNNTAALRQILDAASQ